MTTTFLNHKIEEQEQVKRGRDKWNAVFLKTCTALDLSPIMNPESFSTPHFPFLIFHFQFKINSLLPHDNHIPES